MLRGGHRQEQGEQVGGGPIVDILGRAARSWVILLVAAASILPSWADLRREAEPNDSASGSQPIPSPASVGGVIGAPGDVDLYSIAAGAGQVLTADILARGFRAGANPGSSLSASVAILSPDGAMVLAQDQSAGEFDDPTAVAQIPAKGRYLVEVRHLTPLEGGPDFTYVLSVEVEPGGDFEAATVVLPPALPSIDALIHSAGDQDDYRVGGSAGQVLTVDIDSAVFNPDQPPAKVVVTIFDSARNRIAEDAYTASDPQDPYVQATLPADGSYTIRVRELRSFVGTTNTYYQMSVDLGPSSDNGSYFSGTPVVLPRVVGGVVSPNGDEDHVRFSLGSGATLRADLDARQGLLSLLRGMLALHDDRGPLASDSSEPDPTLSVSPAPGDYSISASGPCSGSGCLAEDSYYVLYLDADADGDRLVLPSDNCPQVWNPDQANLDKDLEGDFCDLDDGLILINLPEPSRVEWQRETAFDSFNLYRGDLRILRESGIYTQAPGSNLLAMRACRLLDSFFPDSSSPPLGEAAFYLVTGNSGGIEGTLGKDSDEDERPNQTPCP